MDANDIGDLNASLFIPGGALHGRYAPAEGVPFTPIPGAVAGWQAPIFPAGAISPRIIRAYAVDVPDGPLERHVRKVERNVVRTVDSVQGREAEVVLVSLVRNNSHSGVQEAIGFLEEPERVNVMFSRARRLLVIVGALMLVAHDNRHQVHHDRFSFC